MFRRPLGEQRLIMRKAFTSYICALAFVLMMSVPGQASERTHKTSEIDQSSVEQLAKIAAAIELATESSRVDPGCQPDKENRKSDLCAQWKAADAASASARWSLLSLVATALGLALGAGTLIAAWRAAHWAKQAAKETARGANAAETSLNEARMQTRPYITITAAKDESGEMFTRNSTIKVEFKNFGTIPARDVIFSIGMTVHKRPIGDAVVHLHPDMKGNMGSIAPGELRAVILDTRDMSVSEIANVVGGNVTLLARFRLDYHWTGGQDFYDVTTALLDTQTSKWGVLDEFGRQRPGIDRT